MTVNTTPKNRCSMQLLDYGLSLKPASLRKHTSLKSTPNRASTKHNTDQSRYWHVAKSLMNLHKQNLKTGAQISRNEQAKIGD